jgi:hypothetical protein
MDYFTDTLRATVAARRSYYNSSSVSPIVVQVVSTPLSCAATGGPRDTRDLSRLSRLSARETALPCDDCACVSRRRLTRDESSHTRHLTSHDTRHTRQSQRDTCERPHGSWQRERHSHTMCGSRPCDRTSNVSACTVRPYALHSCAERKEHDADYELTELST